MNLSVKLNSVDHEVRLLRLQLLHLLAQDLINAPKIVLVVFEAQLEKLQRHLEEPRVVFALEDRIVHVADQVLEEAPDHDVDYLANLEVDVLGKRRRLMILLELHAAGYVLLCRSQVELVQCLLCKLTPVDCLPEVETHIVH